MYIYILFVLLIISLLYFLKKYFNITKNSINIKLKIHYITWNNLSYITNKIPYYIDSYQINYNNCIYKFLNKNENTIFYKQIFKSNSYEIKEDYNKFIKHNRFNMYFSQYTDLIIKTNDINNINNDKVNCYGYKRKFYINDIDIKLYIFDIYDDNYKLYNQFINLFNNDEKNIIKIGTYGNSGTGKTYFLKNIINILKKNMDKNISDYVDIFDSFLEINEIIINLNELTFNVNKLNKIFKELYFRSYIYPKIFYINLDDLVISTNLKNITIKDVINIINLTINSLKLFPSKIIFLFSSTKYDHIYKDFDIIYSGKYLNKKKIRDVEKKLNFKSKLNKSNITINDLISEFLKK